MAGSSFLICIPSSYRFSPSLIVIFFRDIVFWQKIVGFFCTFTHTGLSDNYDVGATTLYDLTRKYIQIT